MLDLLGTQWHSEKYRREYAKGKEKEKERPHSNQLKLGDDITGNNKLNNQIYGVMFSHVEFGQGLWGEKSREGKKEEKKKYLSPHPLGQLPEH